MNSAISTDHSLNWTGATSTADGVNTRQFRIASRGRSIPGVLWTPSEQFARQPLVLIQHGGSAHKLDPTVLEIVQPLVADKHFCVAAIDGPVHGDRRTRPAERAQIGAEFQALWRADPGVDAMVDDWRAAIDALSDLEEVDSKRIGWYGVSMGTAYGLPLVARTSVFKAAVLGKWGSDYPNSGFLTDEAPEITCSVLFMLRWHDEHFSRAGTLDLFDRIGTDDKRLHVYTGSHYMRSEEQLNDAVNFLADRLGQAKSST